MGVLGQVKTDDKSNEITAIPELIKLLDINGCLISIDAIACQTEIAKTIVENGGDYLLAVKGNQAKLLTGIKERLSIDFDTTKLAFEQHHGRTEARGYHVISSDSLSKAFPHWKGLKTIGVAMSYRLEKSGKESLDYRYYISSAKLTEERFSSAVHNHWGFENGLHWVLDTSMNEDKCQIYRENGAEVLAVVRHIALNMLRAEGTKKASIKRKQKISAMNISYLEKVLIAGIYQQGEK